METEKAIKLYFDLGLNFGDILHCLAQNDGIYYKQEYTETFDFTTCNNKLIS